MNPCPPNPERHQHDQRAPMHRCAWCRRWFCRARDVMLYVPDPGPSAAPVSDGICDSCATNFTAEDSLLACAAFGIPTHP